MIIIIIRVLRLGALLFRPRALSSGKATSSGMCDSVFSLKFWVATFLQNYSEPCPQPHSPLSPGVYYPPYANPP